MNRSTYFLGLFVSTFLLIGSEAYAQANSESCGSQFDNNKAECAADYQECKDNCWNLGCEIFTCIPNFTECVTVAKRVYCACICTQLGGSASEIRNCIARCQRNEPVMGSATPLPG